jgi:hypothetical protein
MSGLSGAARALAVPDDVVPDRVLPDRDRRTVAADADAIPGWPTYAVLGAWTLIGLGISAHDGEWSGWGLGALIAAFALLVAATLAGGRLVPPSRRMLAVPVGVAVVAAIAHPARRLMHVHGAALDAVDVLAAVTVGVALLTLVLRRSALGWLIGAGLAAGTGIVTIVVVPDPHIDVWYLLQQSSTGLLHGQDMYRQHWAHSHGLQAIYPYLPMTTVLLAPFRWLLGDVRAGLLVATLLTSVQLRRLAPAAPAALALLVLVQPHWSFLIDQSWTEPLLVVLLATAILALTRDQPVLAVIALAVALACKQHIVLVLPLFALWPRFGLRRTIAAAGLAFVLVLPWILWSPAQFWHDAVKANLDLGVISRALCIPTLLSRHDIHVGFWFTVLVLAVAYAVVLWRAPRTPSGLALGSAVVLLGLDLANKQSFFNHYTLPMGLLVVAMAAASGGREEAAA